MFLLGRGYYDRCVSLEEPLSTCAVSSVEEIFFDRMAEEERAAAHQEQIAQIKELLTNVQYRRLWLLLRSAEMLQKLPIWKVPPDAALQTLCQAQFAG